MKIEMGESLFYSWLRHVKDCQIVQTNWKTSPKWNFQHEAELSLLMKITADHFESTYGYQIFKQNNSIYQLIRQTECDALGISVQNGENQFYVVDVAFHGDGLNYGTKEETVMKVVAKTIKTAMCIYGYLDSKEVEIIFASPKINSAILQPLEPCVKDLNRIFQEQGYDFSLRIIANEEFNNSILQPILLVSADIADTSELFIRAYQMFTMFADKPQIPRSIQKVTSRKTKAIEFMDYQEHNFYKELKIGKLAQIVLSKMLEDGLANENEIKLMQQSDYSKQIFDLQYPLLVKTNVPHDKVRYYAKPLIIRGVSYKLCSQWYESTSNNDRPYLINWIEKHRQ